MTEWTNDEEAQLILMVSRYHSVDELKPFFPEQSSRSILSRLKKLSNEGKIQKQIKIRLKNWNEDDLIKFAKKGLNAREIAENFPDTTVKGIVARLSKLRGEGKLPEDYIVRTGIKKIEPCTDAVENKMNQSITPPIIPEKTSLTNKTENNFDLNERISKLEVAALNEIKNNDVQIWEIKKIKNDLSFVSSEVNFIKQKNDQLSKKDIDSIQIKILHIEKQLQNLELSIEKIQKNPKDEKNMWDAFQQAAEFKGSSELIKILKDAEYIFINKK